MGLGGCPTYSGGPHQYTERQMRARIRRLRFKLWRYRGVDVVLSHAPVYGYGDMPDLAHRGFECFRELIDKYQPKLWIHGHVHQRYGTEFVRVRTRGSTRIVNACAKWEGEV